MTAGVVRRTHACDAGVIRDSAHESQAIVIASMLARNRMI
jgi:hypothetical protein